jgi:hypothetical protein
MPVPRQRGELSGSRSHEAGLGAGVIHPFLGYGQSVRSQRFSRRRYVGIATQSDDR